MCPMLQIFLVLGETFSLFTPGYAPARLYRIFIWGLKPPSPNDAPPLIARRQRGCAKALDFCWELAEIVFWKSETSNE